MAKSKFIRNSLLVLLVGSQVTAHAQVPEYNVEVIGNANPNVKGITNNGTIWGNGFRYNSSGEQVPIAFNGFTNAEILSRNSAGKNLFRTFSSVGNVFYSNYFIGSDNGQISFLGGSNLDIDSGIGQGMHFSHITETGCVSGRLGSSQGISGTWHDTSNYVGIIISPNFSVTTLGQYELMKNISEDGRVLTESYDPNHYGTISKSSHYENFDLSSSGDSGGGDDGVGSGGGGGGTGLGQGIDIGEAGAVMNDLGITLYRSSNVLRVKRVDGTSVNASYSPNGTLDRFSDTMVAPLVNNLQIYSPYFGSVSLQTRIRLNGQAIGLSGSFYGNRHGTLVGTATVNGVSKLVKLNPVPEPVSLVALVVGLAGVVSRRRNI